MNEALIQNWNEVVTDKDVVYHLGDFSLNLKAIYSILPRLNRKEVHLIKGNHDLCHETQKSKKRVSDRVYIDAGFTSVSNEMLLDIPLDEKQTTVKLCHLPYAPAPGEPVDRRYMEYRPKDDGHILLHGHIHTSYLVSKNKRMFNCGVDLLGYKPISVRQLTPLFKTHGIIK